jgi:uncharacterized protein YaaQ
MKLLFVIIRDIDGDKVIQTLVENDYRVTRMASTGGFLRRGNVTLMIGVEDEKVQTVVQLLNTVCSPAEREHNRATVFGVDMPYFEQI